MVGFLLIAIVFVIAVTKYTQVSDMTAAVGAVTSVVGTLVGTFFGVQAGSTGTENANAARKAAENRAETYAAFMGPDALEQARARLATH